jgi:HlyD family secretion protein
MNFKIPMDSIDWKKPLTLKIFGGAVIFLIILVSIVTNMPEEKKRIWVPVKKGPFKVELIETGEVQAVNYQSVTAPMEWRMDMQIIKMVPEGTFVKPGDFLVKFDTSTIEQNLETENDNYNQLIADLKRLDTEQSSRMSQYENDLKKEQYSLESAKMQLELLKFESRNRQEDARLSMEKAKINLDDIQKKIEAQKIKDFAERQKTLFNIDHAKTHVDELETTINNFTINATVGGMIVYREIGGWNAPKRRVQIGDKPRPGEAIINISDLSKMKLSLNVNEVDVSYLKPGDKVTFTLDAFNDTTYTGTLNDIAPIVEKNPVSRGRFFMSTSTNAPKEMEAPKFSANVLVDGQDPRMKPGITAKVRIIIKDITHSIHIPIGAVFEDLQGKPIVFTKRKSPEPTPVKLGERNNIDVVVESGLNQDDQISLTIPGSDYHPLGWFTEMKKMGLERSSMLAYIKQTGAGMKSPGKGDTTTGKSTSPADSAKQAGEKNSGVENKVKMPEGTTQGSGERRTNNNGGGQRP